ncbi:MAG: glycosyltransferase [Acetobacter sp.]|nr:glycosyltransferase [Acetobacter sp.]
MKLSIITICYNIKDEIERTCKSIVSQTNQNFEWIVVDGGSTDGTVDILNKYKDKMTVFISEPDKGIYNAMNKGIKHAKGEYLNFMNGGDSFAASDVVEKFLDFEATSAADVIYGNMNYIKNEKDEKILKYDQIIDPYFFYNNTLNHQSTFIKRELFDKYGLYNEEYKIAADWEKFVVYTKKRCRFEYMENVVANFYEGGISSTAKEKLKNERKQIYHSLFSPVEIQEFERRKLHKYKILLFGIIPFILLENVEEGKKITCKLFNIIPLYKIKRKQYKSIHYLFNFLPLFKIKEK